MHSKPTQDPQSLLAGGVSVEAHGVQIVGPVTASSLSIAKFIAAERAHAVLVDKSSAFGLKQLCDCSHAMAVDGEVKATGNEQMAQPDLSIHVAVLKVVREERRDAGEKADKERSMDMNQGDD